MTKTYKITFLSITTVFALALSYLEMLLPPIFSSIPGIKVGLPNIIIIFLLYKFSLKDAAIVSLMRIVLSSLLFGNVMVMFYSIFGAVLSLALMTLFKKINIFSILGVSIIGGISHNLGQIIAAIIVTNTLKIGYYMIVLTITGTAAGVIVGIAGALLLKYSDKVKF